MVRVAQNPEYFQFMKKLFRLKTLLYLSFGGAFVGLFMFLFLEAFYSWNFRTTDDNISSNMTINWTGLKELKASGGTSVRFPDLKRKLSHIKDPIVIVDGIHEFHGYIHGIPSTFFAYQHKNPRWKYFIRRLIFTGTTAVKKDLVVPESEMARQNGFLYYKVNIGSKFIASPKAIDEIVNIFDALPPNAWVHFHCHYGKGRTSMMLVMYDMMKNAPQVSLEDIIKRQHALGSEDLLNTTVWKKGSYTKQQLEDRAAFIRSFYDFACQRRAGGTQVWSEFKK